MVRNYKRKTADRWSKEDLLEALVGIKEGNLRMDEAAEIYGISRATLYRQYKNFVIGGSKRDVNQFRTTGPNTILGNAEEEVLEQTIKNLREQGHVVSGNDIKRICFEYCDSNGIPNKFNQEKRMASDDWYYGFLNRHPGVKISRPTKQNGSGEASGNTSAPENPNTLSASDKPRDVYAVKDGTIVLSTAPTKVSRTTDKPKQSPSINLKSALKKSNKRAAGTGEETPPGNDCKRAKKDSDQSSVLEGVENRGDENANMEQKLEDLEGEDDQMAESTDKEDEEEDEDDKGVEMDKELLEDASNGGESDSSDEEEESDTSESGEEDSDAESGEEKDGIEGAEESDNDSDEDNETSTESSSPQFSDIESD